MAYRKIKRHVVYLKTILVHKWFVLVAGRRVGVSVWQLLCHDLSKLLPSEYFPYLRKFGGLPISDEEWDAARRRHYRRNPHHHNYWVADDLPTPMPERYVREMVADWLAAGRTYTGSWDIQPWLSARARHMKLHPETLAILTETLAREKLTWPA